MESSSRLLVFLGLSFTGLTAAVVYLLLRKEEESGTGTETEGNLRTSRRTVIKVKVPNECMATIIGRGGCKVKEIQEKSGARVNCNDERSNDQVRIVTIQGTSESAQLAESMIYEIIMNQPLIISHEMFVPSWTCGRIIGKGGESIRSMTRISCCKIMVDSTGADERSETRILLKGTAEQIATAKALIDEKVQAENEMRHRFETRSPRREAKDRDGYNYLVAPSDDQDQQPTTFKTARLDSSRSDGFFDVFVSAAVGPHQFWVQSVSPRGVELDQLIEEMTEYYSKPENQDLHILKEISVGQIVAAPFDHDDKWYRAEILTIEEDEYDPMESKVTLYYGDYGDSCIVKRKQLFDLRTDFLGLYFQAIECALARVKPIGEEWSTEASDLFEELAEVALWQKKVARVVTYRDSPYKRGQRAGSPVPVIELHDKSVDIGEELVKKGFAAWESPSPPEDAESKNSSEPTTVVPASSLHDSVNNKVQSPSDLAKSADPLKMAPSAVFGAESSASSAKKNISNSSAFLKQERGQKAPSGFRPKTLEPLPKKVQKAAPVESVYLPEHFSDDDSDDGFSLG